MSYTQGITRSHRTLFIIAIDQSGSMAEKIIYAGSEKSKAEAVAEIANRMILELIQRAKRNGAVRDYYDIAVIGYSGDGIESQLSDEQTVVPIVRVDEQPVQRVEQYVERASPKKEALLLRTDLPRWIYPKATGGTPMYEVFLLLRDLTAEWCDEPAHGDSFPPIIFNITDGESSDCDEEQLEDAAEQIRRLGTTDGKALLVNIHIASDAVSPAVIFPTEQEVPKSKYARTLFDCSSYMPDVFTADIRKARGDMAQPPFRGMSFNATLADLITILNIGSISVQQLQ